MKRQGFTRRNTLAARLGSDRLFLSQIQKGFDRYHFVELQDHTTRIITGFASRPLVSESRDNTSATPSDERRAFALQIRRDVTQKASQLYNSQSDNLMCIVEGDIGGQTYLTIPSQQIKCSPDELVDLVFDIDFIHWREPDSVNLSFYSVAIGEACGGGMGGARATGSLWLHETIAGSNLARRIESVLLGKRPRIWPSRSSEFGKPNNPSEVIDLLDEESGDGPVFETIRTAVQLQKEGDAENATRLFGLLRKFLSATEPRNRIEAARHLLDKVDAQLLVDALYEAAAGELLFPKWGMWCELAIYTLARLAKASGGLARQALEKLSA